MLGVPFRPAHVAKCPPLLAPAQMLHLGQFSDLGIGEGEAMGRVGFRRDDAVNPAQLGAEVRGLGEVGQPEMIRQFLPGPHGLVALR